MFPRVAAFLRSVLARRRAESELDEELRLHVEMETQANIERGMPPGEARRIALRDLGGVEQTREAVRDVRRWNLDAVWQGLRYCVRVYRRRPVATALSLLTLTLAMGTTTGVFSVVSALLLKPLPFRAAERLVELQRFGRSASTQAGFHAWRTSRSYLEDAVFYSAGQVNLGFGDSSDRVRLTHTSSNFFSTLGIQPVRGRAFAPGEDVPGRSSVAVVSYPFWQQRLGGTADVVGSDIRLNGRTFTIVGVAPRGVVFPAGSSVWTPTAFDEAGQLAQDSSIPNVLGRVKGGLTMAQAAASFEREAADLGPFDIRFSKGAAGNRSLVALRDSIVGPARQAVLVLLAAVACILLIACSNVANLILMRVTERQRELLVRSTLGAGRRRIVQQLATESAVLSCLAGTFGFVVAGWVTRLAAVALPPQVTSQSYSLLDWRVFAVAAALICVTTAVAGVLPALHAVRLTGGDSPLRAATGVVGAQASHARRMLVGLQVALSLVLLAGATVLGRSFVKLLTTDLGLRTANLITLSVNFVGSRYQKATVQADYVRESIQRLRDREGVLSVGAVEVLPLDSSTAISSSYYRTPLGRTQPVGVVVVSPNYFRTMGIELLHGREFIDSDRLSSERVAVVSQELAEIYGGAKQAVGRVITLDWFQRPAYRIVGVAHAVRSRGPAFAAKQGLLFVLSEHRRNGVQQMSFVVRVSGDPKGRLAACRTALQSVERELAVHGPFSVDERLDGIIARPRFYATVVVFLGGFALMLAVLGIYALSGYSVVQRTHEIGVRLAMGGSASAVRNLLLRQALMPVAVGIAAGLGGVQAFGSLFQHLVTPAAPIGVWPGVLVAALLAVTAVTASWLATRRVLQLDPVEVLRSE